MLLVVVLPQKLEFCVTADYTGGICDLTAMMHVSYCQVDWLLQGVQGLSRDCFCAVHITHTCCHCIT